MKKLNVRFSTQTNNELDNIVKLLGFDTSKVARAAMDYGIQEIMRIYQEEGKKNATAKIGIHMLREKLKEK